MKVHHTGYAVREIVPAAAVFEALGFSRKGDTVRDEARGVEILFMRSGQTLIELVAPLNDASPVVGHLRKSGPSPYHICYETQNIEQKTAAMRGEGFMLVEDCREAAALGGRRVAFLYSSRVGLIELVEE
jgi:methylmalonyl-CoA/ethylmalonyl-CoA epimerase